MTTYTFKYRRDTAANWASANPILLSGEPGLEENDGDFTALKFGNGTDHWNDLPYFATDSGGSGSNPLDVVGRYGFDWATLPAGTEVPFLLDRVARNDAVLSGGVIAATTGTPFYTGSALRGVASLDAGSSAWFTTGYTLTAQAGLLPMITASGNRWCELFNIPLDAGDQTDSIEVSWHLNSDGSVSLSDDWGTVTDGNGGTANWVSDPIPGLSWRDGIPLCNIIVTATGLNTSTHTRTLSINGEQVINVTLTDQDPYVTPEPGSDLRVGSSSSNPTIIKSLTFKDQGGTTLYSFNASAPTGWTIAGSIMAEPLEQAIPTNDRQFTVSGDTFDVAEDEPFSIVVRSASGPSAVAFANNFPGVFAPNANGIAIASVPEYGVDPAAKIGDGTFGTSVDLTGEWPNTEMTTIGVTYDRDSLHVYINGVLFDSSTINLGAIDGAGAVNLGYGTGYLRFAGFAKQAFPASTHAAIHAALVA